MARHPPVGDRRLPGLAKATTCGSACGHHRNRSIPRSRRRPGPVDRRVLRYARVIPLGVFGLAVRVMAPVGRRSRRIRQLPKAVLPEPRSPRIIKTRGSRGNKGNSKASPPSEARPEGGIGRAPRWGRAPTHSDGLSHMGRPRARYVEIQEKRQNASAEADWIRHD